MKWALLFFIPLMSWAQPKTETFVVQLNDRSVLVHSPEKRKDLFSVIVENRSLSDQVGKFTVEGKILKFINVKSGKTETIEIENKTQFTTVFVPVSPAFQEVELLFGKKTYEIPSKE